MLLLTKVKCKLILALLLCLIFSTSIAQSAETVQSETESEYVRPSHSSANNTTSSTKRTLLELKNEKRKAEKVSRKLKKKTSAPNTSLSALETEILTKTDQRIDSLSASIESENQSKQEKKVNKEKEKIASKGKALKNKEIHKAKEEAVGKLKETEEAQELEEKMNKVNIDLPDSSTLLDNDAFKTVKGYSQLKDISADSLVDTVKTIVVEKAKERGTQEAMKVEEVGEGKQYLDQLKSYKEDSLAVDHLAEDLINKTEGGKELGKLGGQQDGLQQAKAQTDQIDQELKAMQELKDKEQMKKYAKEKAAKLANGDMAKFAPQIQQAQQQFIQYKKKIEYIKEGSGPNANSLKEEPFTKRFIYGGNFNIPELDPFSVVAAPFIGYRINKKFSSGVSVSYKMVVGRRNLKTKSMGGEVGYRAFTDYKLIKNIFIHGEFERLSKAVTLKDKEGFRTEWRNNGYIGVGRQMELGKGLKMNVMFLCNFLHEDLKYFNVDAFQFRFGVSR